MLIAMMAESFSTIYGNKLEYFLFLKVRQASAWIAYAPVPPPLNLLRIPYEALYVFYFIFRSLFETCCGKKEAAEVSEDDPDSFALPEYWVEQVGAARLTELVAEFMNEGNNQVAITNEVSKIIDKSHKALSSHVDKQVAALQEQLAAANSRNERLHAEVMQMCMQLKSSQGSQPADTPEVKQEVAKSAALSRSASLDSDRGAEATTKMRRRIKGSKSRKDLSSDLVPFQTFKRPDTNDSAASSQVESVEGGQPWG